MMVNYTTAFFGDKFCRHIVGGGGFYKSETESEWFNAIFFLSFICMKVCRWI